jgi:hypothetical protein
MCRTPKGAKGGAGGAGEAGGAGAGGAKRLKVFPTRCGTRCGIRPLYGLSGERCPPTHILNMHVLMCKYDHNIV